MRIGLTARIPCSCGLGNGIANIADKGNCGHPLARGKETALAEQDEQSPRSSFAAFMEEGGSRLYSDLVEHHLNKQSTSRLQQAVLGEMAGLPRDVAPLVIEYIDAVNLRLAHDEVFWKSATCREAAEELLDVAANMFSFARPIDSFAAFLSHENNDMAFALFQIATLSFAYSASSQRTQRKFMGIRKGLFG